jgi:hypothetical protein
MGYLKKASLRDDNLFSGIYGKKRVTGEKGGLLMYDLFCIFLSSIAIAYKSVTGNEI